MQEKLQLLKELQELDQELNQIRDSRRELEAEQATLDAERARVQAMVDTLIAALDGLNQERSELTLALTQERENVRKAEGRLPAIKTQKEYVAVLKEIDTAKKMNKDIEDRIKAKDEEIGSLNHDREEKDEQLAALSAQVAERQGEITGMLADLDQTLDSHGEQRATLLAGLSVPMRKRYQLLFERRNGIAVVEARNGACLGCHMQLPPQLFNSLFKVQELQACPHCNRLLFVEIQQDV